VRLISSGSDLIGGFSDPVRSSKRFPVKGQVHGMIGSEKEKMELVPVSQITISRLFQNGSGSKQACPSSDLVTSSPAKEKQTRKIQKEHLDKKNF
jgi:hypothetical protein